MRRGVTAWNIGRRAEEIRLDGTGAMRSARDVLIRQFDEDALRLLPDSRLSKTSRLHLHVRLDTCAQADGFLRQLDASRTVRRTHMRSFGR